MSPGRDRLVVAGYRGGAFVASRLPARLARRAAAVGARLAVPVLGDRRRMILRHQARARGAPLVGPEADRVVAATVGSYAQHWVASFRLGQASTAMLVDQTAVEGVEHLDAADATGRGTILALPHLGSWDVAAAWYIASRHRRVTTVAEPVEPPALFEWFVAERTHLGLDVLALGPDAGTGLLAALAEGATVALVCDRDLEGTGVAVDFFGERTTLPIGPAALAVRTGAQLLPCACLFDGPDRFRSVILAPIAADRSGLGFRRDVERVTQDLAHAFELLIRRAPEQWHLLQPNWPSDRS